MAQRAMRMPVAGPPVAAAVALGAALVLGGCQAEGTPPTASPTSSPSVSSASSSAPGSPSPSPTESSAVPAAAREKSEKGAEAFVRYFFDQVNRAWTTPEAGLIARLSVDDCEFCTKTEQTAAFLTKEGQRYETAPVTVSTYAAFAGAPKDQHYFSLELTQNRSRILDESGAAVATDPKKDTRFNVAVKWTPDGWRMLGVENAA